MDEQTIRDIVRATISELRKSGMLKSHDEIAYSEMSSKLRLYYKSDRPKNLVAALKEIESDPYFEIIPLYYQRGFSHEKIAEILGVETSTVTRNKKRLCLMLYNRIQK